MTKTSLTRRGALIGAAGTGLAASACSPKPDTFQPRGEGHFRHGVASGDPDQTSVMLWTALSDDAGGYRGVELAHDEAFSDIVFQQGEERTYIRPQPLGTLKILATGLQPGRRYFYRFRLGETYSPTGVTRTLPEGAVSRFRIGVFSCSNFPAGHFNAYREAAGNGDLDLVVHLGDYIYEYGYGGYATGNAQALNRVPDPLHEIVSYEDYVARHAQYKSDPDLQALHGAAPWIMSWDDHETANNSWTGGAQNHNEGEGSWDDRRNAALRAWYDWTPSREPDDLRHRYGAYEIGDLATLCLIESRLSARDQEILQDSFPVASDADIEDSEVLAAVESWKRDVVGDGDRELIGPEQIARIREACAASVAAGKTWRILANQVIMSRVNFPDFSREMPGWLRWWATRDSEFARNFILRTRFDIPFNLDMWDGYPAERERLFSALRDAQADVITITGDVHSFWANDLVDAGGHRIGTEFVGTSVTSPSPFSSFKAPGVDYGQMMADANTDVRHCNMEDHGYIRLTLTPEAAEAEYVTVSTILQRDYRAGLDSRWRLERTADGSVPVVERVE
ncbi:alkaline phosphatase D family protein [Maricaulis sp.]|uniref:alkaline phosphatase D family protein n=1 Tax=Maricaulis sp. TaxID=1486257 RepID=UPI0026290E8B|nr:alkaline phosphatase D family protein [Maricaulis sp.]